ncbi:hypothetical protein BDY21DRAFT_177993 [Lineolata rhizophorae]|uniref:Chitin synthesis regulation, congo red resistance, RCR protein n=1 Tax=Lineolata rhizophorae TaxID=578093 RepID=A0A6A6P745_9PEZI|nr:hypothetical protein BDY21DRAFT_177993 [Lineolata rhizophorae]
MEVSVVRRQYVYYDDDGNRYYSWWSTPTGYIVKYTLLGVIFLLILLWIVGGYMHAQIRMKKGLAPLSYHRFLVPRSQRARFPPAHTQNNYTFYRTSPYDPRTQQPHPDSVGMNTFPEPPPVYSNDAPPQYQPPPGASKVDPAQGQAPQDLSQAEGGQIGQENAPNRPEPMYRRFLRFGR